MQIPKDLSQANLPYSMRYYDPIIAFVQEEVSLVVRQRANERYKVAYEKFL